LTAKTLVLGIGNTLLSDEGVGVHMLNWMQAHHPDIADVDYLDGGTLSFTLAPYIEEADNLIVVDAAELQAAPGTLRVFRGDEMDRFAGKTKRSVHEVSLGDLLAIAHLTGCVPQNRALVAIQPQAVDWGSSLSNPVKRALPGAGESMLALMSEWHCALPGDTNRAVTVA
jgi:hydrogenase maturation protease